MKQERITNTNFKVKDVVYCVGWNDFNKKRLEVNKSYTIRYIGLAWDGPNNPLVQELYFEGMPKSAFRSENFITIDEYRKIKLDNIFKK